MQDKPGTALSSQCPILNVPGQQMARGDVFPLVLGPARDLTDARSLGDWVTESRVELLDRLTMCGAVLLRGFPVDSVETFDQWVRAFDLPTFAYASSLSDAVRINRTERVFTANEAPANVPIYLHHEMAQTPRYPSRLFFYCERAPTGGGQTPLCRSDRLYDVLATLSADFLAACEEKGLRYHSVMPADDDPHSGLGRSWRSTLSVQGVPEAERRLSELGYRWQWLPYGCLRVRTPVLPAVRTLADGRKSFFNQLIAASRGWNDSRNNARSTVTFGDDTAFDTDALKALWHIADELTFDLEWRAGDVVLIDNFTVMHGRRPYQGPRSVLVSLAA